MQLGDLAFGQGDQSHTGEGEVLLEARHILLIARQAIECFGDHRLKLTGTCILEQLLVARAKSARATDGMVGVGRGNVPAFGLDPRAVAVGS